MVWGVTQMTTVTKIKKPTNGTKPEKLVDDTEPLMVASVPDISFYNNHIPRTFHGVPEFDIFRTALRKKLNILNEGPTGSGKTTSLMAFAAYEGLRFYSVMCGAGTDPSQLFGKWSRIDGEWVWVDGPVTSMVRWGKGILLWNEVNFLPDRIQTVAFSLMDKRREISLLDLNGEVIRAADDLLIVGDMNPGYEGTRELNKAFRNRFPIQLQWDYDTNAESSLVKSPRLLTIAAGFRKLVADGQIETPTSTNMLMEFDTAVQEFGLPFAVGNFVQHFAPEERTSIKSVFDAVMSELEDEYEMAFGTATTDEDIVFSDDDDDEMKAWAFGDDND